METLEKTVNGKTLRFLNTEAFDPEDWAVLSANHFPARNLSLSLSDLEKLPHLPAPEALLLTGGDPGPAGFEPLYAAKGLKTLVLDYEETDSDEDGIRLDRLPELDYVLSRSNLNIYHLGEASGPIVEVRNFWRGGKAVKITLAPGEELARRQYFVILSTEGEGAAVKIMEILNPIQAALNEMDKRYSSQLDRIAIIPFCISDPTVPERRYVSLKKRCADLRLRIDWADFVRAAPEQRRLLCLENLRASAAYIAKKDASFHLEEFLADVGATKDS